jgi:hypothetical protein
VKIPGEEFRNMHHSKRGRDVFLATGGKREGGRKGESENGNGNMVGMETSTEIGMDLSRPILLITPMPARNYSSRCSLDSAKLPLPCAI